MQKNIYSFIILTDTAIWVTILAVIAIFASDFHF